MPFDLKKKAETTAFGNNCSFHCVTHFLCNELEEGTNDTLSKLYNQRGYKTFLQCFGKYYGITPVTYSFLKQLVKKYVNPIDREAIFGPVLRDMLVEIMKHKGPSDSDVALFQVAADQYIKTQKLDQVDSDLRYLVDANKDRLGPNSDHSAKALQEFYKKEGFNKYAAYLGDAKNRATISSGELALLTTELNIALKVFSEQNKQEPYFPNLADKNKKQRVLTVFNGGWHWEFEAESEDATLIHNQPYNSIKDIKKTLREDASASQEIFAKLAKDSGATFSNALLPGYDIKQSEKEINKAIQKEFLNFKPEEIKKEEKETKQEPKTETETKQEPKKESKTETQQTPQQPQNKPPQTLLKPPQTPLKPATQSGNLAQSQQKPKPPVQQGGSPSTTSSTPAAPKTGTQQQQTQLALDALRKRAEMLARKEEEKKKLDSSKTTKPK